MSDFKFVTAKIAIKYVISKYYAEFLIAFIIDFTLAEFNL